MDPTTGAIQKVGPAWNTNFAGTETGSNAVDLVNREFFVLSQVQSSADRYLTIDIDTGAILADVGATPAFRVINTRLDSSTGKLVGTTGDANNVVWVARMTPSTGVVQNVAALTAVVTTHQAFSALDVQNQKYFVYGAGPSLGGERLFTVDLASTVVTSVPYPPGFADFHFDATQQNLVGFRFDGTNTHLTRVNPATGAFTDVTQVTSAVSVDWSVSAFDAPHRLLFTLSNAPCPSCAWPGAATLDTFNADTGQLVSTIPWPDIYMNMEVEG